MISRLIFLKSVSVNKVIKLFKIIMSGTQIVDEISPYSFFALPFFFLRIFFIQKCCK